MAARLYDLILEPLLLPIRRQTVSYLREHLQSVPEPKVLEIACGTGTQTHLLKQAGFQTFAIDRSTAMLRQTWRKLNAGGNGNDVPVNSDAARLPFVDASFDAVIVQLSLHEMNAQVRFDTIREMLRTARKGAVFIVVDFVPRREFSTSKCCITAAEILAGPEHFKNGRRFLKSGGLIQNLRRHKLDIVQMQSYFHGNIGLAVARSKQ